MYAFGMDSGLFSGANNHLSRLSASDRRKQAQALVRTYNEMLDRAEATVREGRQAFIRNTLNGVSSDARAEAERSLNAMYTRYESQVSNMRTKRMEVLRAMVPADVHDLI